MLWIDLAVKGGEGRAGRQWVGEMGAVYMGGFEVLMRDLWMR